MQAGNVYVPSPCMIYTKAHTRKHERLCNTYTCDSQTWNMQVLLNYIKDWAHVVQTRNFHRFAYNRYLRVTVGVD